MSRSLRVQLIAIVVATVATVLVASQSLDTSLSERALEGNLRERASLALETVDSLWGRSEPGVLTGTLTALADADRDIRAIEVFRLDGNAALPELSTRRPDSAPAQLSPAEIDRLAAGRVVTRQDPAADPPLLYVMRPLRREEHVVGVAEAEVSLADAVALQRRLRIIDSGFLALSILSISTALALFLERRVTRPVTRLVDGMRRAEGGALDARVEPDTGEFGFLARSFNRMLARIEELTAGLESRVRQATAELRQANEQLWHAQLEVGRSERLAALGQMAATIAHELGTPLNSVLGYTQLLLCHDLPSDQAEKLRVIESQVQRVIETIRNVLDRTRDRDLQRAPVLLGPLVSDILDLLSSRLTGGELVARSEVPDDLPPIPGDPIGLRQVLLNLLTNAIDATRAQGTITVSAAVLNGLDRPGRYVEVAVRDSGHGMGLEAQRRAFEPFYTTKAPGRGTGLGLSIVDHIVRAHGGWVVIDSEPGHGTTMRVRLPLEV